MNQKIEKLLAGETIISREPGDSMLPLIRSRQPVTLEPTTWDKCKKGDMVYCRVNGKIYTHLVKAKNVKRGVLIGNNHGKNNGWTKTVYGLVTEVHPMDYKEKSSQEPKKDPKQDPYYTHGCLDFD
jgi:hypothetical protein